MKNKILPIGSIITVKGQDVMICSYLDPRKEIQNEHYDYACCLYPNGMGNDTILVKKNQIQRVRFIGFQDERFEMMKKVMESNYAS